MANYNLICPFLTDDKQFAYGVEFGMLYYQMQYGNENRIENYYCLDNEEQILLLANRLNWNIIHSEIYDEFWTHIIIEKN